VNIPPALKNLTVDKAEFIKLLLKDDSKGVIVAEVAFLDFVLEEALVLYFCGPSRRDDFTQLIVPKLNFGGKISSLQKITLTGRADELRGKIVKALRPMQELRNVAAHAALLTTEKTDRLFNDLEKRKLMENFPTAFKDAAKDAQEWIYEIQKLPGFAAT
jgi:hypothetical protein